MTEDIRISLLGKLVNYEEAQKLLKEKKMNISSKISNLIIKKLTFKMAGLLKENSKIP